MDAPLHAPEDILSGEGLLKSNLAQEREIRVEDPPGRAARPITADRRAIPAGAREGVWHARDGLALRRIDWETRTDRGSVLFLPGRGDAYEKYLETLDQWAARGWRVTAIDWRGQAGSGRLGRDPITGHIDDFTQWVDDLSDFWRDWASRASRPRVVVAHSMGGHLALRAAAQLRIAPDALVLCAPMLGLARIGLPPAVLHAVAWAMCLAGDPRRPAWKWNERPGQPPAGRMDLLTHDAARYADELWWRERRPELAMGPPSWGWIERAYASMRLLARPGVLERLAIPTLVLATSVDRLVDPRAAARAARRLPRGELLMFGPEARHEILRETDAVRDRALATIDEFLDRAAPVEAR